MRKLKITGSWVLAAFALLTIYTGAVRADDPDWKKKALALNDITGTQPARGQLLELLRDKAGTKKLLAEAAKLAKEKDQPFNLNATLILARAAQAFKEYDVSLVFYRLHTDQASKLQSTVKIVEAYNGLIALLYQNKQYAECVKACREYLELAGDDSEDLSIKGVVQRRRVLAMFKMGKTEAAMTILDKMIEESPKSWLDIEVKAQLLREEEKYEESVKVYLDLIEQVKGDSELKKDVKEEFIQSLRYALSGVYLDLNQFEKGTAQLEILLKDDPDNATYNNDLGYIWADHDMKLDEAEKMIRKAIEIDNEERKKEAELLPDEENKPNPAYLDSLGWVLYKKKKYAEAKPPLIEACKDTDLQDATLWDHLGDVHAALGEKKEAVEAWKKALELSTTRRDKQRKGEIEKKIKAGS